MAALAWLAVRVLHSGPAPSRLTYAQFVRAAKTQRIHDVVFAPAKQEIDARFINGVKVTVDYPTDQAVTELQKLLRREHIPFATSPGGGSP